MFEGVLSVFRVMGDEIEEEGGGGDAEYNVLARSLIYRPLSFALSLLYVTIYRSLSLSIDHIFSLIF